MDFCPADFKPVRPGVYVVEVLMRDPVTFEPLGTVERFARFHPDRYWCCWGISAERAARCDWAGPLGGYPWHEQASTIPACSV